MELKELLELAGHMRMPDAETGFNPLACFIPYVNCKEIVHTLILEKIFNLENSYGAISFINHFIPEINLRNEKVTVIKERKVQRVLTAGAGYRSIDLCLTWKDEENQVNSIIIENKLNDAYFQDLQIEDYQESLKKIEDENVKGTIVIYGSKNKLAPVNRGVKLISPEELSKWLSVTFNANENILAYANYLFFLNKNNVKMENAMDLTNLSLNEIKKLNELNEAFKKLNEAKNDVILDEVKREFPDVRSTYSKLDEGCYAFQIWNEKDYSRNDLWLALFAPENPANDEQGTDLYIYGHAKTDHHDIPGLADYEEYGKGDGYVFYRSPNNFRFHFFDNKSRGEMISEIKRILDILAEN